MKHKLKAKREHLFSHNDVAIGHIREISNCESSDDYIVNGFSQELMSEQYIFSRDKKEI